MTPDDASAREAVASSREQALADMFVTLADTLVDDYDVVDVLDRLVTACVQLLGVTAAGLLLDDQRGHLALVASSSDETRLLEIFQLQNNEGPCLDCVRTRSIVVSDDLSADAARWPTFVPEALNSGFRAVTAVPLRLRQDTIGGLNLFSDHATVPGEWDRRVAQALADVATIGILQQRAAHRTTALAEQLQGALNSRILIEQAKGVIAEHNGVSMATAFDSLRAHARERNMKLATVAEAVVQGHIVPATKGGGL